MFWQVSSVTQTCMLFCWHSFPSQLSSKCSWSALPKLNVWCSTKGMEGMLIGWWTNANGLILVSVSQRGSTEQMSWNVSFLMQIMFEWHNYMVHEIWGRKDHPNGLGQKYSSMFGRVSTLQPSTPQPGPLFIPKQDRRTSFMIPNHPGVYKVYMVKVDFQQDRRTSFMIPNHPGVYKVYMVKVDFPPFWHPFCWFSLREMGQNEVGCSITAFPCALVINKQQCLSQSVHDSE